ncbi:hypothetical protein MNBD_BACTEROID03-571 [hydrothermal vent metagenome]|uniref:Uncharacterized protein n=1 Tax=hydrothermal vent metagenome TaxID=652676 RepID=A0A3B0TI83_9ZZZZ
MLQCQIQGKDFKTNKAEVILNSIFYHTLSERADLTYNVGAQFAEVDSFFIVWPITKT